MCPCLLHGFKHDVMYFQGEALIVLMIDFPCVDVFQRLWVFASCTVLHTTFPWTLRQDMGPFRPHSPLTELWPDPQNDNTESEVRWADSFRCGLLVFEVQCLTWKTGREAPSYSEPEEPFHDPYIVSLQWLCMSRAS